MALMNGPERSSGGALQTRWPGRLGATLFLALLCVQSLLAQGVVISEFLASNGGSSLDEDGEASDWIEIHNPTTQAVDLAGWRLTDDATAPGKWTFPTRLLGPGEFLLVWASGKDRRSTGPLHTNFRLDAMGEYLALLPPGSATPTSEFAPQFPIQESDISYGVPSGANTTDLLASAPVWMLIPTSAEALPVDWTAPGPNPGTGWSLASGMGLGFDEAPSGPGADVNLAPQGTAGQSTTGYDLGPANGNDGDPGTFTHTASDDNASRWWVDLETSTEVQRIVLRNRDSCCASRLRDITVQLIADDLTTVVWSSGLLNPENVLGSPSSLTVDLFDLNVGPVAARRVLISRTPDPDLSGSGGSGNEDEDNVLSLGEVEVYGVGSVSLAPLIRTDLTTAMKGRSASIFVWVPFVVEDRTDAESLQLELFYEDGVVTYLNGEAVAALNAPASPVWNSTATSVRGKTNALKAERMDLGPFASLLVPGTNWLAFHGLNSSAANPTFLLSARLLAKSQAPVVAAYLDRPTPGTNNTSLWNYGQVADTRFSVDRGVYSEPFDLVITTATPGARIWYTLDGSEPAPNQGQEYTGPIRISTTTVIRAAAFLEGFRPTGVDTHTYLFPAAVVAQPARPVGFPTSWAGVVADYAMDPRITQAPAWAPEMQNSLRSLPSLSISTPNDNLFGSTRGIYANPERSGVEWERPVSMEWIRPDGTGDFQVDCGLRIQGGYFRQRNVTQKHSLRLLFKNLYGPGRLRTDLFREFGAAREFDTLVLRAGANDGYAWNDARDTEQFIRDEFGRRSLLEMGQPTARGRFVHLYLNGLYWGVYNLTERPAEDFSSTYLGGEPEDWDAINSGDVKNGSLDTWNTFLDNARTATTLTDYQRLKGLNADGSRNPALTEYLDAPNYIDYMLVNIWGGNWDWPNKNFWFGRHRGGLAGGFKFYLWDFENTMGNNRDRSPLNMVSPRAGITDSWVAAPHDRLRRLAEYRMEFADRVHRHFFNGGTLSPESTRRRYQALADGIEPAMLAETARWGDDNWSTPQDITDWRRERDWILNTYLPQRTGIVLAQLRAAGLYPQTHAPGLAPFGGPVTRTTPIVLSTTASELLYTTNGLDPRLPGGEVRPGTLRVVFEGGGGPAPDPLLIRAGAEWRYRAVGPDPGANWNQLNYDDTGWTAGVAPLGYGDGDEATVVDIVDADPATPGIQRNATTLFRRKFTVTDPAAFSALTATVTYDDAAAVYLNGVEILRTDNLPAGAPLTAYASGASSDNAVASRDALPANLLRAGDNVVAVEIRQSDAASSDISFELTLSGTLTGTGGGTTHQAEPIQLAQPGWIRARSRQGSEWSALVEAYFTTDLVPATSNHLVLSEFCYRPADAATDAERAVTTDRDDFEYVELLNASPLAVDLTGVRFTTGILFNFPNGAALGPGERIVLARNPAAFAARFGTAITPLGPYDGNLINSGEELALTDAAGQTIRRFTYLDRAPWPPSANRNGFSLVLIRPDVRTDHSDPMQWRASVRPGGTPGSSDSQRFVGTAGADLDGNGQDDLLDYALGSRLTDPGSGVQVSVEPLLEGGVLTERLVVSLPRNLAADDATIHLESSTALGEPWTGAGFQVLREERPPTGPVRQTFISPRPVSESDAHFVRVRVLLNP